MSRSTISTFELFDLFPDEETARIYLEGRLWPSGPVCPACGDGSHISALGTCATRKAGFYRCLPCGFDFTVRTGTVMERSKVPLQKWLHSMYLLVTARKGISSLKLAKEIGVTQKTAWFILGRLREACGGDGPGGMRERGGRTFATVVSATDINTVQNEIHGAVEAGSQLYTDEYRRAK